MDSILDSSLCPRAPCGHRGPLLPRWEAFRHSAHNGSTPLSDASFASPLALAARRVGSLASPLPGATRLRVALLGRQRSIDMVSISITPNRRSRWAGSSRQTCAASRSLDQDHQWLRCCFLPCETTCGFFVSCRPSRRTPLTHYGLAQCLERASLALIRQCLA